MANCCFCAELTSGVKGKTFFIVNLLISYKETWRRALPYRESKLNLTKTNSREKLSKTTDLIIFSLSYFFASMEILPSNSWLVGVICLSC